LDRGENLTLLDDIEISLDDVDIRRQPIESEGKVSASPKIIVSLDTSIDKEQELEGLAREVVSRVQNFRKQSGLKLDDRIELELQGEGELNLAIETHSGYICEQTLAKGLTIKPSPQGTEITDVDVEKQSLKIALSKV
jgi:isoleucyl-tRNA synthetase